MQADEKSSPQCVSCEVLARLAQQVAAISFSQTAGKLDADLEALRGYIKEKQAHANRQESWQKSLGSVF